MSCVVSNAKSDTRSHNRPPMLQVSLTHEKVVSYSFSHLAAPTTHTQRCLTFFLTLAASAIVVQWKVDLTAILVGFHGCHCGKVWMGLRLSRGPSTNPKCHVGGWDSGTTMPQRAPICGLGLGVRYLRYPSPSHLVGRVGSLQRRTTWFSLGYECITSTRGQETTQDYSRSQSRYLRPLGAGCR